MAGTGLNSGLRGTSDWIANNTLLNPIQTGWEATHPGVDMSNWFAGIPGSPGYNQVYDKGSMALLPGYEKAIRENSSGFNELKDLALRHGSSAWANLAHTQQALQARDSADKAKTQVQSATGDATDHLAMQGGLTSGARERVAELGANNLVGAQQGIEKQKNQNNMQISMNDEQNRMANIGQLTDAEGRRVGQWEGVRGADNQNQMTENQSVNAFNQNKYNQQMQTWAAGKQAQATAQSGKGGGK